MVVAISFVWKPLVIFSPGFSGEIPVGIHSNGQDLYQNHFDRFSKSLVAAKWEGY
jgi:hypothetical protein